MRRATDPPRRPFEPSPALSLSLSAAAALLGWLPTLRFGLVWDDPMLLALVGQRVREGGLARLLGSEFLLGPGTSATGFYRPVVLLSLFLDGRLGGGAAWAYHATNILLHAICSILVLALARRLLTPAAALAAALLFALHPVHAEAVAFVSARTDLWATAFVLASVLSWLRCRERGEGAFGWTGGASALCLVLGALSKEISLVLPAVLLAWEALSSPAGASARAQGRRWWTRWGSWLLVWTAAGGVVVGLHRGVAGAAWGAPPDAAAATPAAAFVPLLLIRAMGYLRLLFLPWPLSANYTVGDLAPDPGWILGAVAAAATILAGCFLLPARTGWKGALWIALFLAPVMGFVPIASAVIAERFLYLPSVGFCLIVGGLYGRWRDARKRPLPAASMAGPTVADLAMAAVLLCCAAGTLTAQRPWRDEETLYTRMARTSPECFVAHFNLGNTLARAGRIEEARAEFQRAVQLAPARADAWNNLGSARESLGNEAGAAEAYARASSLRPDHPLFPLNLGNALMRLGREEEAEAALRRALELDPGSAQARQALAGALSSAGFALLSRGETAGAEKKLREAARLDPGSAVVRYNLAITLFASNRPAEARAEADLLRGLDPELSAKLEALIRRNSPGN